MVDSGVSVVFIVLFCHIIVKVSGKSSLADMCSVKKVLPSEYCHFKVLQKQAPEQTTPATDLDKKPSSNDTVEKAHSETTLPQTTTILLPTSDNKIMTDVARPDAQSNKMKSTPDLASHTKDITEEPSPETTMNKANNLPDLASNTKDITEESSPEITMYTTTNLPDLASNTKDITEGSSPEITMYTTSKLPDPASHNKTLTEDALPDSVKNKRSLIDDLSTYYKNNTNEVQSDNTAIKSSEITTLLSNNMTKEAMNRKPDAFKKLTEEQAVTNEVKPDNTAIKPSEIPTIPSGNMAKEITNKVTNVSKELTDERHNSPLLEQAGDLGNRENEKSQITTAEKTILIIKTSETENHESVSYTFTETAFHRVYECLKRQTIKICSLAFDSTDESNKDFILTGEYMSADETVQCSDFWMCQVPVTSGQYKTACIKCQKEEEKKVDLCTAEMACTKITDSSSQKELIIIMWVNPRDTCPQLYINPTNISYQLKGEHSKCSVKKHEKTDMPVTATPNTTTPVPKKATQEPEKEKNDIAVVEPRDIEDEKESEFDLSLIIALALLTVMMGIIGLIMYLGMKPRPSGLAGGEGESASGTRGSYPVGGDEGGGEVELDVDGVPVEQPDDEAENRFSEERRSTVAALISAIVGDDGATQSDSQVRVEEAERSTDVDGGVAERGSSVVTERERRSSVVPESDTNPDATAGLDD